MMKDAADINQLGKCAPSGILFAFQFFTLSKIFIFTETTGSFEYTFTDRELEDVLGFIERRQSETEIDPSGLALPSFPQALQFQVSDFSFESKVVISPND